MPTWEVTVWGMAENGAPSGDALRGKVVVEGDTLEEAEAHYFRMYPPEYAPGMRVQDKRRVVFSEISETELTIREQGFW